MSWCRLYYFKSVIRSCRRQYCTVGDGSALGTQPHTNTYEPCTVEEPSVGGGEEPSGGGHEYESTDEGRRIGVTVREQNILLAKPHNSPTNSKLLKVSLIGSPNAGKSTLINTLMGWKVCTSSSKVHTTRRLCRAVLTDDRTQLLFLDTPGIMSTKHYEKHISSERSMLVDQEKSVLETDLLAVVHDVSNKPHRDDLHPQVVRLLALYPHKPAVLILNKIDVVKSKRCLLYATEMLTEGILRGKLNQSRRSQKAKPLTTEQLRQKVLNPHTVDQNDEEYSNPLRRYRLYKEYRDKVRNGALMTDADVRTLTEEKCTWPGFNRVFMVSSTKDDGVADLRKYLLSSAMPGEWIYNDSVVTDQNPQELAVDTVRECLLDNFHQAMPYNLIIKITHWEMSQLGCLSIIVKIFTRKNNYVTIILGPGGSKIYELTQQIQKELQNSFRCDVSLKIGVARLESKVEEEGLRMGKWPNRKERRAGLKPKTPVEQYSAAKHYVKTSDRSKHFDGGNRLFTTEETDVNNN